MKYYETKIGKIIDEEFNSTLGNAVISYIMDKGMENVKAITDDQIDMFEGNALMTKDFVQSLVRCARRICVECKWIEIIEYIRLFLNCTPVVREIELYEGDFEEWKFDELLNYLDLDRDEVGDSIKLYAVVDVSCLKEV